MDLDDVVKLLLPKSARKGLKKKVKKFSFGKLVKGLLVGLFGWVRNGRKSAETRPQPATQTASKPSLTSFRQQDPIQQALQQARTYEKQIATMARQAPRRSLEKDRLTTLSVNVKTWVQAIERIAQKLVQQETDPLLIQERRQVPEAIKRLEKQLSETKDPQLTQKLQLTLDNRRKQLAQLGLSQNNRQLAELKVENTLAQLGIIYSQIISEPLIAQRGAYDRLSAEIREEVLVLEDYLTALDEVQQNKLFHT